MSPRKIQSRAVSEVLLPNTSQFAPTRTTSQRIFNHPVTTQQSRALTATLITNQTVGPQKTADQIKQALSTNKSKFNYREKSLNDTNKTQDITIKNHHSWFTCTLGTSQTESNTIVNTHYNSSDVINSTVPYIIYVIKEINDNIIILHLEEYSNRIIKQFYLFRKNLPVCFLCNKIMLNCKILNVLILPNTDECKKDFKLLKSRILPSPINWTFLYPSFIGYNPPVSYGRNFNISHEHEITCQTEIDIEIKIKINQLNNLIESCRRRQSITGRRSKTTGGRSKHIKMVTRKNRKQYKNE